MDLAERGSGQVTPLSATGSSSVPDAGALEIQTDRLLLRRFRNADLDAFVAYRSEESVARFQSWDQSYSKADAERFLAEDSKWLRASRANGSRSRSRN
jgi:RimJ/RimL family protein N-acetyltransferase